MPSLNPEVDAYIERSAAFARPILEHVRDVIHAVAPDIQETMKWGRPHFEHHGIVCGMAAFKSHCSVAFPKAPLIHGLAPNSFNGGDGMGNFGRLTSVDELPSREQLGDYIREALRLNEEARASR